MKQVMKRRMVQDGTIEEPHPDPSDGSRVAETAWSKPGFEDFDLAPRLDMLDVDVAKLLKHNQAIKTGMLRVGVKGSTPRKMMNPATGLLEANVKDPDLCHRLAAFLQDKANRSPEGYLVINGRPFPGYDMYSRVHGKFNPSLQMVHTTRFHGKNEVAFVLGHLFGLKHILLGILHGLGVWDQKDVAVCSIVTLCDPPVHF